MLKLRLTRMGSKDKAHYRVVVQEARSKRDGRYVENVGYYNPRTEPSTIVLKMDRVDYWIGVGAQPSDSVASLLRRARITAGGEGTVVAAAPAPVVTAVAAPAVAATMPAPTPDPAPVLVPDAPTPAVEVGETTTAAPSA